MVLSLYCKSTKKTWNWNQCIYLLQRFTVWDKIEFPCSKYDLWSSYFLSRGKTNTRSIQFWKQNKSARRIAPAEKGAAELKPFASRCISWCQRCCIKKEDHQFPWASWCWPMAGKHTSIPSGESDQKAEYWNCLPWWIFLRQCGYLFFVCGEKDLMCKVIRNVKKCLWFWGELSL